MRFLDTTTGQFVEGDPRRTEYAILSHTWNRNGEQTFQDLRRIQERYAPEAGGFSDVEDENEPSIWDDPYGPYLSPNIRNACKVARRNGFHLIWIDSCCIDKTSSAELSEAINSMYAWYASARVCYAYLADVPPHDDHRAEDSHFRQSVWFTRGWTLQELIAPFKVIFLVQNWITIGSKRDLVALIEEITGITSAALLHEMSLDKFSVAQRLSWASKRETTRVEDEAYSLLGIFDINVGFHDFWQASACSPAVPDVAYSPPLYIFVLIRLPLYHDDPVQDNRNILCASLGRHFFACSNTNGS